MKNIFFLIFLSISSSTSALNQRTIDFSQSSRDIEWKTIENQFVKLVFPKSIGKDSSYIANLVEHYSKSIGLTYGIKEPKKLTLIIRPELSNPNGFVTLSPRRSEWFSSSTFSTEFGSSEWYQTLAIHEYRHVLQYDYFNRGFTKFASILFGDLGQAVVTSIGLESWYFEGDAVWAETKYSDAGRGRSSLFLSRLKAMLLSGQIPTYDELLNGSYKTELPNQYVFGYVLISNATKQFGEDFWKKVSKKVSSTPHPYRLYTAFKEISGKSFYDFFDETMISLKKEWKTNKFKKIAQVDFRENIHPFKVQNSVYYLHDSLDDYWSIYKKTNNKKEKIIEISYNKRLSTIDIKGEYAVYNQFLPNIRYANKGSSDLYLVDLKDGSQEKITSEKRLYNPKLIPNKNRILVTEFTTDMKWNLSEYDFKGNRIKTISLKNSDVSEVYPLSQDEVVAIISNRSGHKSIKQFNIQTGKSKNILSFSRNNIHSLYMNSKKDIFFEAQYKGVTDIFRVSQTGAFTKCTNVAINALTPFADNKDLYFSNQDGYGSHISSIPLKKCKSFDKKELVDFNYLGDNPSDNYNNFEIAEFKEQENLRKKSPKQYKERDYGHFDKQLFTPHSWSFFVGNGFGVSADTSNFLGTLGLGIAIGKDAAEDQNYTEFNFDLKALYPVINLHAGMRDRSVDLFSSQIELNWEEKETGIDITLPYIYRSNLYTFTNLLSLGGSYVKTNNYNTSYFSNSFKSRDFKNTSIEISSILTKDLKERSIISPWSIAYNGIYENADGSTSADSSYRFFNYGKINIPGLFSNDGIYFTYTQEKQKDSVSSYKFLPIQLNSIGSVFSRGYDYESVPLYKKMTANYTFPLFSPDLDIWGLYYLRRAFANIFYDSTKIQAINYNSSGIELEFESVLFRKLPIDFGVRYLYRDIDKTALTEFYTATSVEF